MFLFLLHELVPLLLISVEFQRNRLLLKSTGTLKSSSASVAFVEHMFSSMFSPSYGPDKLVWA